MTRGMWPQRPWEGRYSAKSGFCVVLSAETRLRCEVPLARGMEGLA